LVLQADSRDQLGLVGAEVHAGASPNSNR